MKKYFKIGMKVSCPMFGNGIVKDIINDFPANYPVKVLFDGVETPESFTEDGRLTNYGKPCLFQGHRDFEEPELKEVTPFNEGNAVWVRQDNKAIWEFRYFSHLDENGLFHCYADQQKKGKRTFPWNICKQFEGIPE